MMNTRGSTRNIPIDLNSYQLECVNFSTARHSIVELNLKNRKTAEELKSFNLRKEKSEVPIQEALIASSPNWIVQIWVIYFQQRVQLGGIMGLGKDGPVKEGCC